LRVVFAALFVAQAGLYPAYTQTTEQQSALSPAAEEAQQKGIQAYKRPDFAEAVHWLSIAADQGSIKAEGLLGAIYEMGGNGIEVDHAKGFAHLKKAADAGSEDAQDMLGIVYVNAEGVPQDFQQAIVWFTKAAEQGSDDAQARLGSIYFGNPGVPQDYVKAIFWLRKAVAQDNPIAQALLGSLYMNGLGGLPQNYAMARDLYFKSAQKGDLRGQYGLGLIYAGGLGVSPDYAEAEKWFRLAADQGMEAAKRSLAKIDAEKHPKLAEIPLALKMRCLLLVHPAPNGAGSNPDHFDAMNEGLERRVNDPKFKACIDDFYRKLR
jgi:TPR repeat protein